MNISSVREAAGDLMNDYCELIDSDRLEEWLDLFTEDASYTVIPRENVEQNLPNVLMWCDNKDMLRDYKPDPNEATVTLPGDLVQFELFQFKQIGVNAEGKAVLLEFIMSEEIAFSHRRAL